MPDAVVYCYDLVPLRSDTKWTRGMDDYLRAQYIPGLSLAIVALDIRKAFGKNWVNEKVVAARLSQLGLRRLRG